MITQRNKTRRRHAKPPTPVQTMPVWKRALAAALLIAGGGGAAVWGVYDVVAWITVLHRAEDMIKTESFILGFPLLGAGICAIGPEFIVPQVVAAWSDHLRIRMAGVILGSILAGILLVFLGQFVIIATTELGGYHACDVGGRGRVIVVTWARSDVACRKPDASR